jgi:hypothetical protein
MATKKKAKKPARKPARKAAMDPEAMMAAWQRSMTPSEGHRRLDVLVGSWRAKTTFTMAPGAPPDVSEGTSENRWILGGRYLEQAYTGSSLGMPFEGLGYTAYDNVRKNYFGVWMDSFGTGLMTSVGVGKARNDLMKSVAEAIEPSGKSIRFDCAIRVKDRDHHTYEMWTKAPNGKRYCSMRVEYTRA